MLLSRCHYNMNLIEYTSSTSIEGIGTNVAFQVGIWFEGRYAMLVVDRGPYICTMGNAFKCVFVPTLERSKVGMGSG